jgi:hypothetical protein
MRVTRARPKVDRIACPWLIRRFIDPDPDPEIGSVAADEVLATAQPEGGRSFFDGPGAHYTDRDRRCSFEVVIDDVDLGHDLGFAGWPGSSTPPTSPPTTTPTPSGRTCSPAGWAASTSRDDDHRVLERASFVPDALYAWCRRNLAAPTS